MSNTKTFHQAKSSLQATLAALIAAVLFGGLAVRAAEPDAEPDAATNSVSQSVTATEKFKTAGKLTGAELYSIHCNRCHAERYPTERTAAQWKTIMLHMQVRANIPGNQARLILKYLQENSGR